MLSKTGGAGGVWPLSAFFVFVQQRGPSNTVDDEGEDEIKMG